MIGSDRNLCGLLIAFVLFSAYAEQSEAQQHKDYSPSALRKYADNNRKNHIEMIALHFRPKADSSINTHVRIVVKKTGAGEFIVNPKGEKVGWSEGNLEISKIDRATAIETFGAIENTDGTLTCDLITDVGATKKGLYHLDLKYLDNKVGSYRLKGADIVNPVWVKI